MAESLDNNGKNNARLTIETSNTPVDFESSPIIDPGATSDDEPWDTQEETLDDATTAIGVSISHEQIRLTSPRTPAAEKAAAIERAGGFFGYDGSGFESTLVEEPEETDEEDEKVEYRENKDSGVVESKQDRFTTSSQHPDIAIPERSPRRTPVRLPSPWRAEAHANWQDRNKSKTGLFGGIVSSRRRSLTGPEPKSEGWQKWLLSNLPSRPKYFSLSSPFSGSQQVRDVQEIESGNASKRSSSGLQLSEPSEAISTGGMSTPQPRVDGEAKDNQEDLGRLRRQSSQIHRPSYGPPLRRSTSDQSFMTQRTLSTVESLGDDSRFEHVQEMANNRLKAIKDSWQDSSIRMPSLSNFNVPRFTPDFIRDRSGSLNKKQSRRATAVSGTGAQRSLDDTRHPENVVAPHTGESYNPQEAAASEATSKPVLHPHFSHALRHLEGDIVVLGGYRGSILRSAEPPNRQLWVPVRVGLNLRKADLEVGFEDGDDARATEKIIPGGMLTHIGPVDMSRRLFKRLRSCHNASTGRLRVHDYGYDWRLDPNYLSDQLVSYLETLQCNSKGAPINERGATVIAHSLGGLITRHAVNRRPELFRGVVYAATPHTCVNILGPMRNGDDVLLSNRVLTAQVNFSIRTSFALLPLDGRCFFDKTTGEEYPVDFFDPQTWIELRLSPCVGRPLPPLTAPAKASGITAYVSSMASALPSIPLPGRKSSLKPKDTSNTPDTSMANGMTEPDMSAKAGGSDKATASGNVDNDNDDNPASASTTVTIPREKAQEYLTRTLASVKKFKQDLAFNRSHADLNVYPPISVIYGKSTPTVYGAKVDGRDSIKHADAYDQLAFASGDGVVLARAAMVPQGYKTARNGVVSTERGHVTLLSDLEAVGKCLNAIRRAREKGVGCGNEKLG